ncbi:MAG TPA: hypothetical protein VN767_16400 [Streptosporangiaceae bacterium]|jgi:hypothetical protein|nr:hypothetical protein [Streptosporangiaceae bacterium]
MSPATRSSGARRAATVTAAALLSLATGAATLALTAGTASASTKVHASYKVTGSTFLKGPNFSLPLGPGSLASVLNPANGNLTADLTMPDTTGSFKQAGLIPVTATTRFINVGKTTGKLNLNTGAVATTSKITLRITKLIVSGLPVPVGPRCETAEPVVVQLKSQKGFNVLKGGKVAGVYTIGKFHHCLLATPLINITIPASGNTITLKLGKAKLG